MLCDLDNCFKRLFFCVKKLSNLVTLKIGSGDAQQGVIHDQRVWSIKECGQVFEKSITSLKSELSKQGDGGLLIWDKVWPF